MCTYGHPPLKSELNAAKTRVSTVPSYSSTRFQYGVLKYPGIMHLCIIDMPGPQAQHLLVLHARAVLLSAVVGAG